MRFCVYQGITTLINSAYQNRVMHEWKQCILAIMTTVVIRPTSKTNDEITGKTGNRKRLVCESMEACISISTCEKSSI
jgi:hypothetical protein